MGGSVDAAAAVTEDGGMTRREVGGGTMKQRRRRAAGVSPTAAWRSVVGRCRRRIPSNQSSFLLRHLMNRPPLDQAAIRFS